MLLCSNNFDGNKCVKYLFSGCIIEHLKRRGIGILISDHNVRDTLGVCDRAYILCDGQVIESGDPQKIANSEAACRVYLGDEFKL